MNPEKVKAILDMVSPKTVKEVQRLMGLVAALNRFEQTRCCRLYDSVGS